jgi:hypothetical protein
MARKRAATAHKFKNPQLNAPILINRPGILAKDEDITKMGAAVTAEEKRKFELLFAEFGLKRPFADSEPLEATIVALYSLAYKLACLYVPGMQMTFNRQGPGAPKRAGLGSNPTLLLAMVDMTKDIMGLESDRKVCEFLVLSENPELKSPARKVDRNKRVRTLANLVSKARNDAAQPRH